MDELSLSPALEGGRDPDAIVAVLAGLAVLPLGKRVGCLGAAARLSGRTDLPAEIRAAALSVLAGCTGIAGLRAIVAALEDPDPMVWRAALSALRTSAATQPLRWAHALFHARVDVRAAALDLQAPEGSKHLIAYLRADPALRDRAAAAPWRRMDLRLMLDLHRRGAMPAEEIARAVIAGERDAARTYFMTAPKRAPSVVRDALARWRNEPTPPGPVAAWDVLDAWCDIVESSGGARIAARKATLEIVGTIGDRSLPRRALVSWLSRGELTVDRATFCAALDASFVRFRAVPLPLRRQACRGLGRAATSAQTLPDDEVDALLDSDLVQPSGALGMDLIAAASIVRWRGQRRLERWLAIHPDPERFLGEPAIDDARDLTCRLARLGIEGDGDLGALVALLQPPDPERVRELAVHGLHARAVAGLATSEFWALLGSDEALVAAARRLVEIDAEYCRIAAEQSAPGESAPEPIDDPLPSARAEAIASHVGGQVAGSQAAALLDHCGRHRGAPLADALARWLLMASPPQTFAGLVADLSPARLAPLLELIEQALIGEASRLALVAAHARTLEDPTLRAWGVLRQAGMLPTATTRSVPITALTAEERGAIATSPAADLEGACLVALTHPRTGLTDALTARTSPEPCVMACVALLGCRDPLAPVATQLDRFWDHDDPDFAGRVYNLCARSWAHIDAINLAGNAFLWRWDAHTDEIGAWLGRLGRPLEGVLAFVETLPGKVVGPMFWDSLANLCLRASHRDKEWIRTMDLAGARTRCLDALGGRNALAAARILVIHGITLEDARARAELVAEVYHRADVISDDVRFELRKLGDFDGIPRAVPRIAAKTVEISWWRRFVSRRMPAWSQDVEALVLLCASADAVEVERSIERLIALGGIGQIALVGVLEQSPSVPHGDRIARSVSRWTSDDARSEVLGLLAKPEVEASVRFWLALSLAAGGHPQAWSAAVDIACEASVSPWFSHAEWQALHDAAADASLVAERLILSPHHHAYRRAVETLCGPHPRREAVGGLLRAFLRFGHTRPGDLRVEAARWLWREGDPSGVDVLATKIASTGVDAIEGFDPWRSGTEALDRLLVLLVDAALVGGAVACLEMRVVEVIDKAVRGSFEARRIAAVHRRRLLLDGIDDKARAALVSGDTSFLRRDRKLLAIASVFAWGVRRGRDLTGRVFGVHMTHKRKDLGHTRLSESRIFVSPLPLLRGDPDGRDVVEGLILHEFGHHMFHAGPGDDQVWRRAQREGLFGVLNLVADEHLERNLRSVDVRYGDRLKRLAAFAFQHDDREVSIDKLTEWLGAATVEVLAGAGLKVAYRSDAVCTSNHALLAELDRLGNSFARFVKALRMGQGNRSADPLVERALALFPAGTFRHSSMQRLWEISLELADLFGIEANLAECFGGHESLEWGDRDSEIHGEGIGDDEVQREVERILDPRRSQAGPQGGGGRPHRLQINVSESEWFAPIDKVERVPMDRDRHRAIASETRGASDRLRGVLERLGLRAVPQGARMRGRAFDRSRTMALVVRRDPRILMMREMLPRGDLFIGVAIDCSGSMSTGQSMDKAHRFCVTLAEAVRDLRGIDARFFGFTDTQIYDAGDARECAAAALSPGGGNNDAAGLQHVATVAMASPRRHKLIVMVSDGLPTECTVGALRGLVRQLERRHGMLCAQVAVRPLEEKCFHHYVEIAGDDIPAACARFARVVADLVARTQSP